MKCRRLYCVSAPVFCCAGTIPKAVGALTSLRMLFLGSNQLTGKPGTFCLVRLRPPPRHLHNV